MTRALVLLASAALFAGGTAFACGENASMCQYKAASLATVDVSAAEGTKAQLDITGLTCASCASNAQSKLMDIEGVNAATVNHESGKAELAYDAEKTDLDKIIKAFSKATDYKAAKVESEA